MPPIPHTSCWTRKHVAAITGADAAHTIAPVDPASLAPVLPGIDLWDLWPLQNADGTTTLFDGWSLWFVLSAPALPDPDKRHDIARIRLIARRDTPEGGQWHDCGNALPDGLNPGSREWAGSALFDPTSGAVTLFYTVAGYPGENPSSFAQRLFQTTGRIAGTAPQLSITDWSTPVESFASDNHHYVLVNQREGVPGFIKGFRDPAHFRDPADGRTYILFTGSLRQSDHGFNGCIGIAQAQDESLTQWAILPPLVSADGLNNEQERPLVIARDGLYYLFWSTQRKVFAPDGPNGPNGLYGMVADTLMGPWRPLNGTGLVAGNPASAPFQTYSWWVEQEPCGALTVWGFADFAGVAADGVVDDAAWRRNHFGGTPAPTFRIALDGDTAQVCAA
ncbi:MAG TPA: glycoside hydrolase family 68 protein [Novosphingobium sp.]|nr:glycoside hydrolase family 68 protein [Novosphingobium sp.]